MNNMKHKILMTLALLITAVGGAWAEKVTVTFTQADLNCTGTVAKDGVTLTPSNGDAHSYTNLYDFGSTTFSVDKGKFTKIEIVDCSYGSISGWQTEQTGSYQPEPVDAPDYWVNLYTLTWTGEAESVTFKASVFEIQRIVFTIDKPDVDVTLNEAKTEASFDMPTFDTDVDYELVRDMSVQMQALVGDDAAKEPRYRVQWNDEKETFEPAELKPEQVLALFSVNDLIEKQALKQSTDYFVSIYAVDAEGNPTGNAMDFTNFTFAPGRYCVTATGGLGGPYDGTTAPSNIFELYQGYQVVIPAGEYVTYYKDEAVRLEEADKNDIELCTITAVEDGKAVLSNNFDAMKANTPFLLKNTTSEEKTILLIPCNEPDLAVTVAKEFKGTEGPCVFSEELMATGDFYVCNGKEFIKVRGAGTLAANKAYLFVEGNNTPASIPFRRSIGGEGEGTTSIDNLNVNDNLNDNEATWYDLNGRKLNGKPAQKGIYIKNGKKVVVH